MLHHILVVSIRVYSNLPKGRLVFGSEIQELVLLSFSDIVHQVHVNYPVRPWPWLHCKCLIFAVVLAFSMCYGQLSNKRSKINPHF